jgi:hypothetical protein
MRRVDLPELEDQAWFPVSLRDAMTGYLRVVIELARPYDVAAPALAELLDATSSDHVVDLASGGGGPWGRLIGPLRSHRPSLGVTLTDLNPNRSAASSLEATAGLGYHEGSVSALDVPPELGGVRTMVTALHHFDREQVRAILEAAQRDRVGFAAFEATQRSVRGLLVSLFVPLLVLLLMPRVRPRRVFPLLLTYLPPLLPLLIWWDGFASTLRSYTVDELRALVAEIQAPGYAWDVREVPVRGAPIPVLQLTGRPVVGAR